MQRYIPDSEELRLRELRAERKSLWRRFEENPSEIQLAAKIKIIDDQIATPYQQTDGHGNQLDDSEVTPTPKVEGIYLLLAISQRVGSQVDLAQLASRNSASERATHSPSLLAEQASSGNSATIAQTSMRRRNGSVGIAFQKLDNQEMAPAYREAGLSRRGRSQRKARRVDQNFQSHNRNTITQ